MNNKFETFKIVMRDKTSKLYYVTKNTLLDYLTARDYLNIDYIEIINKGTDKTKHRKIKITDLK